MWTFVKRWVSRSKVRCCCSTESFDGSASANGVDDGDVSVGDDTVVALPHNTVDTLAIFQNARGPRCEERGQEHVLPREPKFQIYHATAEPPVLKPTVPEGVGRSPTVEQDQRFRELMKEFLCDMLSGKHYCVVSAGQSEVCTLYIGASLDSMNLDVKGVRHTIQLKHVKTILPGRMDSRFKVPVDLDDFCATLVLTSQDCVSFRLTSLQERDKFVRCMKVLVLAWDT